MNNTLIRASLLAVPILVMLGYAASAYRRSRAGWSLLLLGGAICFGVVVLTHVAEALHVLPMMGWGEPHSVGHYIDFSSAVGGAVFFAAGVLLRVRAKTT